MHTGHKLNYCKECGKGFPTLGLLKCHKIVHSGVKGHVCESSFTNAGSLRRHKRIHTGEKPFKCRHCEKSFTSSGHRTLHERGHTGERPYSCDECGKSFRHSRSYRIHHLIHTKEIIIPCEVCGKIFNSLSSFEYHERTHTGEKPFKCKHTVTNPLFQHLCAHDMHMFTTKSNSMTVTSVTTVSGLTIPTPFTSAATLQISSFIVTSAQKYLLHREVCGNIRSNMLSRNHFLHWIKGSASKHLARLMVSDLKPSRSGCTE